MTPEDQALLEKILVDNHATLKDLVVVGETLVRLVRNLDERVKALEGHTAPQQVWGLTPTGKFWHAIGPDGHASLCGRGLIVHHRTAMGEDYRQGNPPPPLGRQCIPCRTLREAS